MTKTTLVVVCPRCDNYPITIAAEPEIIKHSGDDLLYFIAHGCDVLHIELDANDRYRVLGCKCEWSD